MGFLDTIKSRLGGGDQGQDGYDDDNGYYENEEYYEGEEYYEDERYYDDSPGSAGGPSSRRNSVFDDYTPLVSMSDVRSQELPRFSPSGPTARTRQATPQIRTSLPFIGDPAEALEPGFEPGNVPGFASNNGAGFASNNGTGFTSNSEAGFAPNNEPGRGFGNAQDPSSFNTGPLSIVDYNSASGYSPEDSADPLLRRHSLSNTGDFAATSPSYYASRSGTGHVRPAGQGRKTHRYREAIVINPSSYAEAEQVAIQLRRKNAVILVLTQTRPELAKRILDFSFGAAAVAEGQVTNIGERIYALTCDHPLTDAEMEQLQTRGVL